MRASTVLLDGFRMSIRALLSAGLGHDKLSLYLWTARRIVTTSLSVGRGSGQA